MKDRAEVMEGADGGCGFAGQAGREAFRELTQPYRRELLTMLVRKGLARLLRALPANQHEKLAAAARD
jgi:hypothetical protein